MQTARREYGHHKFAIEAERRRVTKVAYAPVVEQAEAGARVGAWFMQEAAARAVPIPIPKGVRVQDSVLVEAAVLHHIDPPEDLRDQALRAVPRQVAHKVTSGDVISIVDTSQAVPAPAGPAANPALAAGVPLPPGYVAVQSQLVAAMVEVTQAVSQAAVPDLPDAMPLMEDPTLDDLPIGKFPFEFLCGSAGVGKTYLARLLAELMNTDSPSSCILAATTGIAAVNLGEGTTIHALLGFRNNDDLREKYITGRIQLMLRKHRKVGLRRIILDEVSMLDADALTHLTRAIEDVNMGKKSGMESIGEIDETDEAPGQPQVGLTLVGDFAQLAPVPDKDPTTGKKRPVRYAFESVEWEKYAAHITRLTTVRRQNAQDFVRALHAVRAGKVMEALSFFTPATFDEITDNAYEGTTIFGSNAEVDRYNRDRLDHVPGNPITHAALRWGKPRSDWDKIPDVVDLKIGALVMVLANRRDIETRRMIYANGDLGIVERRVSEAAWKVRLHRTRQVVDVVQVERTNEIPLASAERKKELVAEGNSHRITEDGKHEIIGSVTYMPLRCAYGTTNHKSQGLSLDHVQVNIRDWMFKQPGMLFVALSRARTAAGLRIIGNQQLFAERCRVEPRVQPWL